MTLLFLFFLSLLLNNIKIYLSIESDPIDLILFAFSHYSFVAELLKFVPRKQRHYNKHINLYSYSQWN